MSLRFESVGLKNFGPYRQIDSLNLETQPDAPVVLIHGENTLGKTRLFRALRWCLYGSLIPQQSVSTATQQSPAVPKPTRSQRWRERPRSQHEVHGERSAILARATRHL